MMMRTAIAAILVSTVAFVAVAVDDEEDTSKWADTDTTTALWRAISSSDKEALETLLDADEQNAHVRAADGRGPLWWAHEHKNEEAITLLQEKGINENAKDRDGLTAAQVGAEKPGELTEWAKALQAKQAEEAAKRAEEMAAAAKEAAASGDDEWDDDWEDEEEGKDEDWEEYDEL